VYKKLFIYYKNDIIYKRRNININQKNMVKIGRWEFGKSQEANPQDSRNEFYDNKPEETEEMKPEAPENPEQEQEPTE